MNNILSNEILKENGIVLVGLDEIFTQIPKWKYYYLSNYGRLIHKLKYKKYIRFIYKKIVCSYIKSSKILLKTCNFLLFSCNKHKKWSLSAPSGGFG